MVSEPARERILGRLRASVRVVEPASDFAVMARKTWPPAERYPRLHRLMEAVKTEFLETTEDLWPQTVYDFVDGFTTTRGGIAETGGLILWPGSQEPRLLSLVPPVHVALLYTDMIYDTFWEALRSQEWAAEMPPNALLISGPSKTADIEQTLAYGVHGPKRLVVVAVKRE